MRNKEKTKSVKQYIRNIRVLFKLLGREQKYGILLRAVMIFTNAVVPVVLIKYQRELLSAIELNITQKIFIAVAMVTAVMLLQKLLEIIFGNLNGILNNLLSVKLETAKYKKSAGLQLCAYDNPELFEKMQTAGRIGTDTVTDFVSGFFDLVNSITVAAAFLSVLYGFSKVILITTIIGAFPIILYSKLGNSYEEFDKKRTNVVRRKNYFKDLAMDGNYTKEIKLFGIMPFVIDKHKGYHDRWTQLETGYTDRVAVSNMFVGAIIFVFHYIIPVSILIFSISKRELDIAGFTYYLNAVGMCAGCMKKIVGFYFDNCINVSRIEDYFDFINLPLDERGGENVPDEWYSSMPDIEFRSVCFRYEGMECDVLHNLNLTIKSGEKIALIGLNGAGKTTVIKLLCGLYDASEGVILIGGRNILEFSKESLYKLFSVVFQDYINYELSLCESLSLGTGNTCSADSADEIWSALDNVGGGNLRYAVFNDDIQSVIGRSADEAGINLSGGEKQKIVLARCILQDRAVTVLDEPTAALDAYAEEAILKQFIELNGRKTVIIVSHRLVAAKHCDKIVILKAGEIAEYGSHKELIALGGIYAEMWKVQASQYNEGVQNA